MPDPCDESVIDFDANTFANIYHVNPKQCIECVENIKEDFFKMVFPQLFVEQLKKFGIFDNTDMEYYETESHSIGADINNPADRDKCYDCLNEILFKRILMKIESSPNLVNNLIDSFMFDGFYKKIGENLKNSCSKVSTSSALDSAPIKTEDRFVNHVLFNKDRLINVPEEIRYYVDRSALSKQILTHLKSMSDNAQTSWLTLHGMGGSGKTILAANSVRQIANCKGRYFQDGIFWISVGNFPNHSSEEIELFVNSKLAFLEQSINLLYSKHEPKQDSAQDKCLILKEHFKEHKNSLIVLDNVWSTTFLKRFQLGVPVMVTTQNKGLIPNEFLNQIFLNTSPDTDNILTFDESIRLIGKCLDCDNIDELKQDTYLQQILDSINNLPYLIPLIGSFVKPSYEISKNDQSENIWKQLWTEIQHNGDNDEFNCDNLIKQSVLILDPEEYSLFKYFAIFLEPVPIEILETVFKKSSLKIRSMLEKLYEKSLITKNHVYKTIMYTVHDITRRYLQNTFDSELKKLHADLVNSYLNYLNKLNVRQLDQKDNYDFAKYIFQYLSSHIYSAQMFQLFPKLYLDFFFLQKNIGFIGTSNVLGVYHYFAKYFEGYEAQLIDYQGFIGSICDPKFDLLQMALCRPSNSHVYLDAHLFIEKNQEFYFEWCNKKNFWVDFQQQKISFKAEKNTSCAILSSNSDYILTSVKANLNLWNAKTTGNITSKTLDYTINHCVFSRDEKFILTCFDNNFAILWQFELTDTSPSFYSSDAHSNKRRNSKATEKFFHKFADFIPKSNKLKEDSTSIETINMKCGDISHNNKLVMLGNNHGHVYIYSVKNCSLMIDLKNDEHDIKCCSFSNDSSFVLVLINSTVRIYSLCFSQNHLTLFKELYRENSTPYNAVFDYSKNDYLFVFVSYGENILEYKIEKEDPYDDNLIDNGGDMINVDSHKNYSKGSNGHFSLCAVSPNGNIVAGFDVVKKEILLWNRNSFDHYKFFRFKSSIVSLSFSKNSKDLLACNDLGDITIWQVDECFDRLSSLELKTNFSVCSTDSQFNVLTIDSKGFPRLFMEYDGLENRKFGNFLRHNLQPFHDELLALKVMCCDINSDGYILFATNSSQVFLSNTTMFEFFNQTHSGNETVFDCKFVSGKNEYPNSVRMVTISDHFINIFLFNTLDKTFNKIHTFDTSTYRQDEFDCFKKLHVIPNSNWIFYYLKSDSFGIYDFMKFDLFKKGRLESTITSVDFYHEEKDIHLILLTTTNKLLILLKINSNKCQNAKTLRLEVENLPRCCSIRKNTLVYGCDNGNIYRLNYDKSLCASIHNRCIWKGEHSNGNCWVTDIAVSIDEQFIISAADSIKLWQTSDGKLLQTFVLDGSVSQMFVQFKLNDDQTNITNFDRNNNNEQYPDTTVVTVTDANLLYILRTFARHSNPKIDPIKKGLPF